METDARRFHELKMLLDMTRLPHARHVEDGWCPAGPVCVLSLMHHSVREEYINIALHLGHMDN